jgi:cytochrome c5
MSDNTHDEAHTGPIKNPKQLLLAVFMSFVVPVFAIIGLVYYVGSANKPAPGVSADDMNRAVAERIQKVGSVEIRDANRPLKSGEEVYKVQCVACHGAGVAGAPKFGDAAVWTPRIATGYEALLNSALKGKGAMAAQGGGDNSDTEIARAVVYMANAAGGKFAEPAAPAPAGAAAAQAPAETPAAAPAAAAPAPAAVVVAAAPAAAAPVAASANGEALYKTVCMACHVAGVAGAPKLGDKAAWAPRIATGLDALTASVIKGKNAMPPKGGAVAAPDADVRAAVEYMVNASK